METEIFIRQMNFERSREIEREKERERGKEGEGSCRNCDPCVTIDLRYSEMKPGIGTAGIIRIN